MLRYIYSYYHQKKVLNEYNEKYYIIFEINSLLAKFGKTKSIFYKYLFYILTVESITKIVI